MQETDVRQNVIETGGRSEVLADRWDKVLKGSSPSLFVINVKSEHK